MPSDDTIAQRKQYAEESIINIARDMAFLHIDRDVIEETLRGAVEHALSAVDAHEHPEPQE